MIVEITALLLADILGDVPAGCQVHAASQDEKEVVITTALSQLQPDIRDVGFVESAISKCSFRDSSDRVYFDGYSDWPKRAADFFDRFFVSCRFVTIPSLSVENCSLRKERHLQFSGIVSTVELNSMDRPLPEYEARAVLEYLESIIGTEVDGVLFSSDNFAAISRLEIYEGASGIVTSVEYKSGYCTHNVLTVEAARGPIADFGTLKLKRAMC